MQSVKVFAAPTASGQPGTLSFLAKAPSYFVFSGIEQASRMEEADFVAVSGSMRTLSAEATAYVRSVADMAAARGKKTLLFIGGDLGYDIHIDHESIILFKPSEYRHGKRRNEVIVPAFTDDPYHGRVFVPRTKSARPVVGFCGFAEIASPFTWGKYVITNAALDAAAAVTRRPYLTARKRGIYFRRKAMRILTHDTRIETRFILRDTFFGQVPADMAEHHRQEYLENMRGSDFALSPRGDGNYSRRFFRALSMGVIPVLIDTDMVLPLEHQLDYSRFTVRVPHTDMHALPERILSLWHSLSEDEFIAMQFRARSAFMDYLRQDVFYSRALQILKEQGPEAL